jgi:transcriptional accessory protein Tex/SPT6
MDDLQPGQWTQGTARNVVDFGVFVDVGVGEDGLVHISELSDRYVESPYDVVSVGDPVRVRVVRVDKDKGRIALSMRSETARPAHVASGPRRPRAADAHRPESRPVPEEVLSKRPSSPIQTPKSTLGWDSRRVQKAIVAERLSKTQQQILKKREAGPVEAPPEPQAEEQKPDLAGLISKLGFAAIERRGKPAD